MHHGMTAPGASGSAGALVGPVVHGVNAIPGPQGVAQQKEAGRRLLSVE